MTVSSSQPKTPPAAVTATFYYKVKRILDILGAVTGLAFCALPLGILLLLIYLDDPGAVFFLQDRVGQNGRVFRLYKLRTMRRDAPAYLSTEEMEHPGQYVTKLGRILRKLSLDEIPQLFNVLKGDMSVVGPRPERPYFVNQFKESIPKYMVKHQVKPGLTGWAQIHGCRGDTSIKKRIKYDIEYVENWHMGLDLGIMIKTVLKKNPNAY